MPFVPCDTWGITTTPIISHIIQLCATIKGILNLYVTPLARTTCTCSSAHKHQLLELRNLYFMLPLLLCIQSINIIKMKMHHTYAMYCGGSWQWIYVILISFIHVWTYRNIDKSNLHKLDLQKPNQHVQSKRLEMNSWAFAELVYMLLLL